LAIYCLINNARKLVCPKGGSITVENSTNTGTASMTLSPESNTIPIVCPVEYLMKGHPLQPRAEVVWEVEDSVCLAHSQAVHTEMSNSTGISQTRAPYRFFYRWVEVDILEQRIDVNSCLSGGGECA
jgi:hypothetical protein